MNLKDKKMLESQKYRLIEWIISVADEKIIKSLLTVRDTFDQSQNNIINNRMTDATSSYTDIMNRSIDVERLKKEQGCKPTSSDELSQIAQEADIKESIDFLLGDLKSIG